MEKWEAPRGYEKYRVSNYGRVASTIGKYKILKQFKHSNGYLFLNLGRGNYFSVHRLVMYTFCYRGDYKSLQVNHINGNIADNRLSNLEWVTQEENMQHAYRNGLISASCENSNRTKLSNSDVLDIVECFSEGFRLKEIADFYNVKPSVISCIKTGYNWSKITGIAYKGKSK